MIPVYLYKFDDDTKDENGESNAVFIISSKTNEDYLRQQGDSFDHGGMNNDDFNRAWEYGKFTKITSIKQVPPEWLDSIPFTSEELDDPEITVLEFCENMNYNGEMNL